MAEADWPLRDGPRRAANGSACGCASQGLNDGLESLHLLDHLDSPQLTLHDFHKFQQSPPRRPSPELEYRRLRRKPSTEDLTSAHTPHTDPTVCWPDNPVWTPSLILPRTPHTTSHSNFSPPSSLHYRPLTPCPRTYTASPSLSSTVDTLQSSLFHTPISRGRSRVEPDDEDQTLDYLEPLRTKRKFDSLKRAKRLPHTRGGSGTQLGEPWEVYAAVYSLPEDAQKVGGEEELKLKKGKSVRFQKDTGKQTFVSQASAEQSQSTRGDQPKTSSVSLSRLNWPWPPSHDNWQGTFGHLNTVTPPLTPATILYRGASFDVLNPHASLVLGSPALETPAEIDGLLDSYFEDHDHPAQDIMQNNTTDRESSPSLSQMPSENSRRILYEDAETAYRNILRTRGNDIAQVSALPKGLVANRSGQRPYSDPFDLTLSENSSRSTLPNVDQVLKEGRRDDATRMQPLGLGITDPDDTHATSDQTTNATLKDIIEGYNFTRELPSRFEDPETATSPDIEHGRDDPAPQPGHESSHGLVSPLQTPELHRAVPPGFLSNLVDRAAPVPTPPQPTYNGIRKPALYYTDCSDLPSTDQSYGNTNHLLNITPEAAAEYPHYRPYSPCHPATCVDPAHIHIYQDPDPDAPINSSVEYFEDDDKEEVPPDDYQSLGHAAPGMHGDQSWRTQGQDDHDDGDLGRVMLRSSSFYPEDSQSAWITEADPSQSDLRTTHRFSGMSADSYANTSFVESHHRFSFQPPTAPQPTAQPPLSPVFHTPPSVPPAVSAFGAAKAISDIQDIADRRRHLIEHRIDVLQSKIAQEQVASGYSGSPKIDGAQRRADLAELNRLRNVLPATSRQFVSKAKEAAETSKFTAPTNVPKKQAAFARTPYHPRFNFSRTIGQHDSAFNSGSDTRGLLASPLTPSPYNNLGYSESTGTFMTVQQESPLNVRGAATTLWSPISNDPTHRAIHVNSVAGKKPTVVGSDIELGPMNGKSSRSHRAAIGSQYERRDLQLVKNSKRLTDAQLMERSAGWTTLPSGRHVLPGHYADSSAATLPMLVRPEHAMGQAARMEQKRVSKRYAIPCYAIPPLALAFGFGAFDKSIKKVTEGRVTEACPRQKRWALWAGFPLGLMLWTIFAIVIYVITTLIKPSKESGAPLS